MSSTRTIWKVLPLLGMVATLPVLVFALANLETNTANVIHWLPKERPSRLEYDRFTEQFGSDDQVMIGWSECTLDNPQVLQFHRELEKSIDRDSGKRLIQSVSSGPELILRLTDEPYSLARDEAIRRLKGTFVGPDGEATSIVARSAVTGKSQREILDLIFESAKQCGIEPDEIRLAGSIYDAVVLDEMSRESMEKFLIPTAVLSGIIAWLCLKSVRLTLIVLLVANYCHFMTYAIIHYVRGSMNIVLSVAPTLIYVLGVSGAVHLVNYYRDAVKEHGAEGGVAQSLRVGWLPCTIAFVTTSIGLSALAISEIAPVADFGLYSATSLILSIAVILILLPSLLLNWGQPKGGSTSESPQEKNQPAKQSVMDSLCNQVLRRPMMLTTFSLAIALAAACGLPRVHATISMSRMFPPDSEIQQNYRWMQERIGSLLPIHLVVTIPSDSSLNLVDSLQLLRQLEDDLQELPSTSGTFSAGIFLPDIAVGEPIKRRITERKISKALDEFAEESLVAVDEKAISWHLTVRSHWSEESNFIEMGNIVHKVAKQRLEELVPDEEIGIRYTGISPLVDETHSQLLEDLAVSFSTAFLLITPIMIAMLRNLGLGLLAMLPNLFPTVLVFGIMGWFDIPVDVGTVLCASVALGIAVDDTIHFLTWYRRGLNRGQSNEDAIRFAYSHCAAAMLHTTLICGLGIILYSFSDFTPTSHFAILMGTLLAVALIGDLILLPALLQTRLGRYLAERRTGSTEPF